ncbi:hypothetical protein [Caproiciproducens faecalis]|uniref:Uncharacterized protein n=1 Tax=Caproiciproducens faecalis TaxID=2820301 RepID=A0ABS7DNJ2_9FIRM|nr:hypothetical protein [Caproiciproducens faecalis]MBW7572375.1 hypothetical protein [Caproiciproducens faecalis]
MKDLTLTQSFAMIALNAQNSKYLTTVKKIALRCMAASVILETLLDSNSGTSWTAVDLRKAALPDSAAYSRSILEPLNKKINSARALSLKRYLKAAYSLSGRRLKKLEMSVADSLREQDLLQEIPNLLGCDLYFDSSGVPYMEYRSNIPEYEAITETIKAEVLDNGPVTDEAICMLWLLRESGSFSDFFSLNDLETAAARMNELYLHSPLAKALYPVRIHHSAELAAKQFLHWKKSVFKKPFAAGINFIYPVFERSQSVFIDTEAWFSNADKRLEDVETRLRKYGHEFTVLHAGSVPIIKIDNLVYKAVPQAIYGRVPIHGVRLIPRIPF